MAEFKPEIPQADTKMCWFYTTAFIIFILWVLL
jgi:hypothetical protein|nr:MAG TPA: hypothetical protein [Caudoviricetes sp.]